MMHNFTIKFLIVIVLVWFRLINQHMGVNCNLNRLHNLLLRNSHPCAVNSLCMCTNNGNGTYTYKISCHEVWFYKFTGKTILIFFLAFPHLGRPFGLRGSVEQYCMKLSKRDGRCEWHWNLRIFIRYYRNDRPSRHYLSGKRASKYLLRKLFGASKQTRRIHHKARRNWFTCTWPGRPENIYSCCCCVSCAGLTVQAFFVFENQHI